MKVKSIRLPLLIIIATFVLIQQPSNALAKSNPGTFESHSDLYGVKIDGSAQTAFCRSIPFHVANPSSPGATRRTIVANQETIPVNSLANGLYILGMISQG